MGNRLINLLIIVVIFLVFKNWILSDVISSGDFGYYSPEHVEGIKFLGVWDPTAGGLGANVLSSLWLKAYSTFVVKFSLFLGWNNYVHLFWYFPYVIFSFLSATFLFKSLFKNNCLSWLGGFIYTANTYSLMVVAGGQMGVALAYSISPLVLLAFIKTITRFALESKHFQSNLTSSAITGLLFTVLVMFDLRLAYIVIVAVVLYQVVSIKYEESKKSIRSILYPVLYALIIPLGLTGLLHFFLVNACAAFRRGSGRSVGRYLYHGWGSKIF